MANQKERMAVIARIFFRTIPYFFLRLLVHFIAGIIFLAFIAAMGLLGFFLVRALKGTAAPLLIIIALTILGMWAIHRLLQRYLIYLVRAGHVAVITELVKKGRLPEGVNQISYGKNKIVKHFGTTSVLFLVDQFVRGSVRQILRWLTKAAGCLGRIPGVRLLVSLAKRALSLAANYIDEAVLSYIVSHEEQNVWKAASDGVVIYVQSWRQVLLTSVLFVLFVIAAWTAVFVFTLLALLPVAASLTDVTVLQVVYSFAAVVVALLVASLGKWMFVDPIATVAMIVTYNRSIENMTPSIDLYSQISRISRKFSQLQAKAETLS